MLHTGFNLLEKPYRTHTDRITSLWSVNLSHLEANEESLVIGSREKANSVWGENSSKQNQDSFGSNPHKGLVDPIRASISSTQQVSFGSEVSSTPDQGVAITACDDPKKLVLVGSEKGSFLDLVNYLKLTNKSSS